MRKDVILRPWMRSDIDDFYRHANTENLCKLVYHGFPYPFPRDLAEFYLQQYIMRDGKGQLRRAVILEGNLIGGINLIVDEGAEQNQAEVGGWLSEEFWGHGIMTTAIKLICLEGEQRFCLKQIYANTFADNIGARRIIEKNGFILHKISRNGAFKDGIYHDYCRYIMQLK